MTIYESSMTLMKWVMLFKISIYEICYRMKEQCFLNDYLSFSEKCSKKIFYVTLCDFCVQKTMLLIKLLVMNSLDTVKFWYSIHEPIWYIILLWRKNILVQSLKQSQTSERTRWFFEAQNDEPYISMHKIEYGWTLDVIDVSFAVYVSQKCHIQDVPSDATSSWNLLEVLSCFSVEYKRHFV